MRTDRDLVTVRVPFAAPSVSLVRRALQSWLEERSYDDDRADDARVVISELVANSVRHARPLADGSIVVSWCLVDDALQISVTDGGSPTAPHTVDAPLWAISGRGMSIVQTLSERWWVEGGDGDTTVHTRMSLTA